MGEEFPRIAASELGWLESYLSPTTNPLVERIAELVARYGGSDAINRNAREAGRLDVMLDRMAEERSPYLDDLKWLIEQRDAKRFTSLAAFAERATGRADPELLPQDHAVTLEISWLQVFPCLMEQARQAIARGELMPGRYILGKGMREQERSGGLLATTAAMAVFGVSFVDMLDTNGAADRSNVHLGGPETLAGYFGGIGQPNGHVIDWLEEYLYYYTKFGIRQVLNINYGTVLAGYILHRMGVDIEFKLSVFLGNDNPYSVLMNLLLARLFARDDGTCPLRGLNFSNSISNASILECARIRRALGFERQVRFEHHILQDHIGMVRQPFDRRSELIDLARMVPNISAKHEGGEVEVEKTREQPSTVFDLFLSEAEILEKGMLPRVTRTYLDKHDAINTTAVALLRNGIPVVAAPRLHG